MVSVNLVHIFNNLVSTLPGQKKTYAMLQSLDLICESEEEQKLWLDKV